jgi:uncharacterized protein (DUF1778 family)
MMTLGVYARLDARDERDAIDSLPSLTPKQSNATVMRAAGTDAESVLASCLAFEAAEPRTSVHLGALGNAPEGSEKAVAAAELVEAVGIEPTSQNDYLRSIYVCVPRSVLERAAPTDGRGLLKPRKVLAGLPRGATRRPAR